MPEGAEFSDASADACGIKDVQTAASLHAAQKP